MWPSQNMRASSFDVKSDWYKIYVNNMFYNHHKECIDKFNYF
jgi:hypothetical protein